MKGVEAAQDLLNAFTRQEFLLDIFCRAPSHRHGNLLRGWLNGAVTGSVTPEWWSAGKLEVPGWLIEEETR